MADVVQYKLERMLNELDDLERRGLFNRQEIAEIVRQRRKFEYRLKRPSPLKVDFLAYIDYEKKVDELRLLRKKAFLKQQAGKNKKWKKSVSDFAGVSRIVEIYRLATNRFKGDILLWFQYLEFCRQRSNGRMKKVGVFLFFVIQVSERGYENISPILVRAFFSASFSLLTVNNSFLG
jgi:U3 small nucleolar RNA-associated protein 6